MSSARFPGKVLAPLRGEPILLHVIRRARAIPSVSAVIVLTSDRASDEPVVAYCERLGVASRRGPLDDVLARFRAFAEEGRYPWILRLSADSPLLDVAVAERVAGHPRRVDADVVTTIYPTRTFPRGQNAELIRSASLLALRPAELSADDREHVTPFFYRHPERYRIVSVVSDRADPGGDVAVDTIDDIRRLETTA